MIPLGILAIAPVVFLVLWFLPAPYGRHGRKGWGPELPGRVGWVLMEWPTLVVFGWLGVHTSDGGWVALVLWMAHYVRRTVVYPLRQPSVRPMAGVVVLIGMSFQLANSLANGWAQQTPRMLDDPLLWLGAAVFVVGQVVNIHGDEVLRALRGPEHTGYVVPEAGLYRWVCNVAYLGEMLTWAGWAVLTGTWAGLAFFAFTVANLAPRARSNAAWYRDTLGRMPGRWVLIPGVW